MANGLTLPRVSINGTIINIVPNSLQYVVGRGVISLKAQSAGATVVDPVFMVDKTEAIGRVSFKIYPTTNNIDTIENFRTLGNDNAITVVDGGFSQTFPTMVVGTEDIEYALGVDEQIEVTCKGSPSQ